MFKKIIDSVKSFDYIAAAKVVCGNVQGAIIHAKEDYTEYKMEREPADEKQVITQGDCSVDSQHVLLERGDIICIGNPCFILANYYSMKVEGSKSEELSIVLESELKEANGIM